MSSKIKIALAAVLIATSASGAFARTRHHHHHYYYQGHYQGQIAPGYYGGYSGYGGPEPGGNV
jgi:hypothetical protein